MLLRNVMWDIFQNTGQIEAYLMYRNCATNFADNQPKEKDDLEQIPNK
ncbi:MULTISPECIES: YqzL family protein [Anaerosinus]|uniref:YqzL family protein n=1 Tax=Selenobaculum gibii TaxID=3054208 RepID=A0A9Y2AH10_9FIRM|nr:YqzL family protein [Selenobaculum gbiensis]WIW69788.1 YqzL family protein [Selenobaculum gbiensis]